MSDVNDGDLDDEFRFDRLRVLLLDLDGCLVDGRRSMLADLPPLLSELTARGMLVGLATGRPQASAASALGDFIQHVSGPSIFLDGADTWVRGRRQSAPPIAAVAVDEISSTLMLEGYVVEAFSRDHLEWVSRTSQATDRLSILPHRTGGTAPRLPIYKLTVIGLQPSRHIQALADRFGLRCEATRVRVDGHEYAYNLTAAGVDKRFGALAVAGSLGLDMSQFAFVGDSGNDVSLLGAVGLPMAMGQSSHAVKSLAHVVGPPFADFGLRELVTWLVRSVVSSDF